MNGEILTSAEMRQAKEHADTLAVIGLTIPETQLLLQPIMNYLNELAWKGQER